MAVNSLSTLYFSSAAAIAQMGAASPSDVARALIVPSVFVIIFVVAFFLVIWYIKEYFKRSPTAELDREFRAERDTLLVMAEGKKLEREKQAEQEEIRERILSEMGSLSVEIESYFGGTCPHCLLELSEDTEFVLFLEQKAGVHRACISDYLSANPDVQSKYLYVHPEGTFEFWDDFVERRFTA